MARERVDYLLSGGIVVTMDEDGGIIVDGAVAVKGDKILEVGPSARLKEKYAAREEVDCSGCAVTPGLVNAHTHTPMTLLRGLADDLRLDVWLYGYVMPVEWEFVGDNFSYLGTKLACAEMIRGGVTTFAEMYYYEDEVARAASEAGMRGICTQTVLKFPAPDATSYEDSLEYCEGFIQRWRGHPLITPGVAPHAAYTSTPEMLRSCVRLATRYDVPLNIHIAETKIEVEGSYNAYDMPVVPWLDSLGLFEAKVIAAHCVHLEEHEMYTLLERGAGVAHCPSSNLKLASGIAPVQKMVEMGLNVGIGTDGTASNNDLDMFEETRLASFIAKVSTFDPTALPAKTAFGLATIGGARAVHLDHLTGSLVAGKQADIAVVDISVTHQSPRFSHNPDSVYSQLIYAAKSSDVRDVFVAGKCLMRKKSLLTLDEEALKREAQALATQVDVFLMAREGNLLSKLAAIGSSVAPQETFEVQVKVRLDDTSRIEALLSGGTPEVTRSSVRNQYDTYFLFEDSDGRPAGRIRYREDEKLDKETGEVTDVFYTITLMGPTVEREYDNSVLLTRSRYSALANRSLRFYREYFRPDAQVDITKYRRRYHISYNQTDFAVNLDNVKSSSGEVEHYLEIKSRTWSASDAENKARLIGELLEVFGVRSEETLKIEYIDLKGRTSS